MCATSYLLMNINELGAMGGGGGGGGGNCPHISKFLESTLVMVWTWFDLAVVTLTYKILSGLYLGNGKV